MATYNITMKQYNGSSYDTLYPATIVSQVSGAIDTSIVNSLIDTNINRTTNVNQSDSNYTTYMARGESLNSSETNATVNGTIAWTYE